MAPPTDKGHASKRVPTTARYIQALKSLAPLPPSYVGMLQFHYRQPARTVTATAVAEAVGFKNYRAAGLHYGRLARLAGEYLGWRPQEEEEGEIKLTVLVDFDKRGGYWHWIMREQVAQALKSLGWVGTGGRTRRSGHPAGPGAAGPTLELMPGEMPEKTKLSEGAIYRVAVTAYERNPKARRECVAHYGTSCVVCGFDFKATYGPKAEGFIHVHHVRMLAEIKKEYAIDPIEDLRPVCPNCHSVIHLKTPPYSIEQLKTMVAARGEPK